jgi:hypothetical protein
MIIIVLLAHGLIVLLPLVLLPVAVIHQEAVPVPVAVAIPVAVEVPHVPVAAAAQAEEDKS